MASYLPSSSLLVSFVLVFLSLFLSFVRPVVKADGITDVCTRTQNPSFCEQALRSDSRAATANLKTLGQISIDLARSNATETRNLIGKLVQQTTDPSLKGRFQFCSLRYDSGIDYLTRATGYLKSGDYSGVNVAAGAGFGAAHYCEDAFKEQPPYPSPLTKNNQNLELLCEIIGVISNLLLK